MDQLDQFQYVEYAPSQMKREAFHTNLIGKRFPIPTRNNVRTEKNCESNVCVSLYRHIATLSPLGISSASTLFIAVAFLRRFGLSGIGFKSNAPNLAFAIAFFLASAATLAFSFSSAFCASFPCAANDFTHTHQP